MKARKMYAEQLFLRRKRARIDAIVPLWGLGFPPFRVFGGWGACIGPVPNTLLWIDNDVIKPYRKIFAGSNTLFYYLCYNNKIYLCIILGNFSHGIGMPGMFHKCIESLVIDHEGCCIH